MTGPVGDLAVDVEIDGATVPAGTVSFSGRAARLTSEFRYERTFLLDGYDLDPGLPRANGTTLVIGLPGSFADSTPDWWGRNLINRRARADAREQGAQPSLLTDVDYLVGVSDVTLQGALRFRAPGKTTYVHDDVNVPRLVALPDLLAYSDQVVTDPDDTHVHEALKALLAAGSGTLGGARPKASVMDGSSLYIAKFPHPVEDQWDVMAWEKTVLDLGERIGLEVPPRQLERVGGRSVLLLRRFDRVEASHQQTQRRVGYVSASTLLGGSRSQPQDYLDLQAAVKDNSAAVDADLADLWRRIAFSCVVHNTDDHLRNHGFLRTAAGWRLSPVFDINPESELARPRSTAINGESMWQRDGEALVESAAYFGLSDAEARRQYNDIARTVAGSWRAIATGNGIADEDMLRFALLFEPGG